MAAVGYTLFDTPLGRCAIAWTERGVVAMQLPTGSDAALVSRVQRRFPEAGEGTPPPFVEEATSGISALLGGASVDLATVPLDLEGSPAFDRRVYEQARTIPRGTTRSYGEIAEALGDPLLAREVGRALGSNPIAVLVPCHRVVAADGSMGGFSARGGSATKRRMLAAEGHIEPQLALFEA